MNYKAESMGRQGISFPWLRGRSGRRDDQAGRRAPSRRGHLGVLVNNGGDWRRSRQAGPVTELLLPRHVPICRHSESSAIRLAREEDEDMASIRKEILADVDPGTAWAAVRDIGALHHRLVPGFVVDTRLEADARIVTFGNGLVVTELIVDIDDDARRLAWSARGGRLTHHSASVQVFANGETGSRLVWIADLLPNEMAGGIRAMMDQAAAVMKPTLEVQKRQR